jgi:hypothetical protein
VTMRQIDSVNLDITTVCDRACADCCCRTNNRPGARPRVHHPWSYFEAVAPYIQGMRQIAVTGGEPTTHPEFADFVPRLRNLFKCSTLVLVTDGYRVQKYSELIHMHFDEVHFSDYQTKREALAAIVQIGVPHFVFPAGVNASNFTPRSRRGSGLPCGRGTSGTVAFADGKFWPCCVSPGLDGTEGIEPCADWREKVQQIDMGCSQCFFSPAIEII